MVPSIKAQQVIFLKKRGQFLLLLIKLMTKIRNNSDTCFNLDLKTFRQTDLS